jgi:hypothetical protein
MDDARRLWAAGIFPWGTEIFGGIWDADRLYRTRTEAIRDIEDPIDKPSPARRLRDRDYSARAQANAGSEPRDPFWWSAVLATRAAFAARPGRS